MNQAEKHLETLGEPLDLVWGAAEIGRLIRRTRRQVFHMLEKGQIPAARKIGGCWVISRSALQRQFCGGVTDNGVWVPAVGNPRF
jgi:hypothetical protein